MHCLLLPYVTLGRFHSHVSLTQLLSGLEVIGRQILLLYLRVVLICNPKLRETSDVDASCFYNNTISANTVTTPHRNKFFGGPNSYSSRNCGRAEGSRDVDCLGMYIKAFQYTIGGLSRTNFTALQVPDEKQLG
jgi:hypothetical protein